MILFITLLVILVIIIFIVFCYQNNESHTSNYYMQIPNKILFENIKLHPGDLVFYKSLVTSPSVLFLANDSIFDSIGIIDNDYTILTINGNQPFDSILDYQRSGKVYISFCKKPVDIKHYSRQPEHNHINKILRSVHHHTYFPKKMDIEFIAEVLFLSNIMKEPYYNHSIAIQKNIIKNIHGNLDLYSPIHEIIL